MKYKYNEMISEPIVAILESKGGFLIATALHIYRVFEDEDGIRLYEMEFEDRR